MIEHVSLRCSDSKGSRRFYERALKPLGYVCDRKYGDSFGFKDEAGRHDFWVTPGEVGTPTHLAFHARSRGSIDSFHAAALKAGGKDNGGPGPRAGYAAYAAFVFDPDGNNVEAVIWEAERGASERKRAPASARKTRSRGSASRHRRARGREPSARR
jgi:catechol 2,3-dioxygenase-like lactoylglutathione lyase family enzyme